MDNDQIKQHFTKQLADYQGLMQRLIPHYMELNRYLCSLISQDHTQPLHVLDLGCGNGALSAIILETYPNAHTTALDLTQGMLELCAKRLDKYKNRFTLVEGDYATTDLGSGFDAVVAGLTLHHLSSTARQQVFAKIFNALKPGGVFLSSDIVTDPDPEVTAMHYRMWQQHMSKMGEDAAFWYEKHMQKDNPETIDDLLSWLRCADFKCCACHWKCENFAITGATKPSNIS